MKEYSDILYLFKLIEHKEVSIIKIITGNTESVK